MSETRSYDPSARKLATAAQHGDVAQSQDLTSAALLAGMALALAYFGSAFGQACTQLLKSALSAADLVHGHDLSRLVAPLRRVLTTFAPFVWMPGLFVLVTSLAQSGFSLTPHTRRSSSSFVARLAPERAAHAGLLVLKVSIVLWVVVPPLLAALPGLLDSFQSDPERIVEFARRVASEILVRSAVTLLVIGTADFIYQRVRRQQRLRMTRREVVEERRQSEGDPQLASERRRRAHQVSAQMGIEELARVSVVVRGLGDHVVALRVNANEHPAPRLWIKARGELGERLRERAAELGLYVHHDDELCAQLYRLETSEPIEPVLYARVAQLMALEARA